MSVEEFPKGLSIVRPQQPRFEGDFRVEPEPGYAPTSDEQKRVDWLNAEVDSLAAGEQRDKTAGLSPSDRAARQQERKSAALSLSLKVGGARSGTPSDNRLFAVKIEKGSGADAAYNVNLSIKVRELPGAVVPPEKEALFTQINAASNVVSAVCIRRAGERAAVWPSWLWEKPARDPTERVGAMRRLEEYTGKLAGIAEIGLEGNHTNLAKLALDEFKNEVVTREASRIKNTYVVSLGIWAALATLIFTGIWVWIVSGGITNNWWWIHKSFLLAGAGAAVGTWLSFSVRRVQLSFDQLVMLEEQSLDPPLRIIFVVALTMMACLLFWTNAINIEVGLLKTNSASFQSTGSVALLIGMLSGLAERALATAISGRAAAFVQGFGAGG